MHPSSSMAHAGSFELSDWMPQISDAARIVFRQWRGSRNFDLELSDLVQIGCERVLTYLSGAESITGVLVFVCAKQGMQYEARRSGGMPGNRKNQHGRPDTLPLSEPEDDGFPTHWRKFTPALPIEEMIDAKRALLALPMREAYSWLACDVWGHEKTHAANELGMSYASVRVYLRQARRSLGMATDGKWGGEQRGLWERLDDDERRELVRLKSLGLTWRELAARTGHNVFWLRRVLREPAPLAKAQRGAP